MNFLLSQIKFMLTKKSAVLVYAIILFLVLANYFQNVFMYRGSDLVQMYHPMSLILLTGDTWGSQYLLQIFPFLVVLATGWTYFEDRLSGQQLFWTARVGRTQYYVGKVLAVFVATFLVFSVPFFLEMILNMIAFPAGATGDLSNMPVYDEVLLEQIKSYLWYDLYVYSRYLYVIFRILLWGLIAGIMASFTVALSFFNIFKFRVLLFLPVYVLIYAIYYANSIFKNITCTTYYANYLTYYDASDKFVPGMVGILLILILVTFCSTAIAVRKDVLNE